MRDADKLANFASHQKRGISKFCQTPTNKLEIREPILKTFYEKRSFILKDHPEFKMSFLENVVFFLCWQHDLNLKHSKEIYAELKMNKFYIAMLRELAKNAFLALQNEKISSAEKDYSSVSKIIDDLEKTCESF